MYLYIYIYMYLVVESGSAPPMSLSFVGQLARTGGRRVNSRRARFARTLPSRLPYGVAYLLA